MRNLICYLILFFFVSSCKEHPTIKLNKELLILEKNIREETSGKDHTYINEILENDLKNCNANIYMHIYIENKKIASNEESIMRYLNSLSLRVNNALTEKKCIDSLIIEVSADCLKNERHNSTDKRYSFPIL